MPRRFARQKAKLTAAEINRWNRVAGIVLGSQKQKIPTATSYDASSRVVMAKNHSGADRSAFQVMSLDGMEWDLELDGSSGLIFKLDTADPDKPPAILLGPIADGETGLVVVDGLAMALVEGGSGTVGVPSGTTHNIEPGTDGEIKILSAVHATDEKLLPVVLNAARSTGFEIPTLRKAFKGVDAANTPGQFEAPNTGGNDSYIYFPSLGGGLSGYDFTHGSMSISYPLQGGSAPALAQLIQFDEPGIFAVSVFAIIGASTGGVPIQCRIEWNDGGSGQLAPTTNMSALGATGGAVSYQVTVSARQLIKAATAGVTLHLDISAAPYAFDPIGEGWVTIEKLSNY